MPRGEGRRRRQRLKMRNLQGGFRRSGITGARKKTEQPPQFGHRPSRFRLLQHPNKKHPKCQAHFQTFNIRGTRHGSWRT